MEDEELFIKVRAVGALITIVTVNAVVILAWSGELPVPKWSILVLLALIFGLLAIEQALRIVLQEAIDRVAGVIPDVTPDDSDEE